MGKVVGGVFGKGKDTKRHTIKTLKSSFDWFWLCLLWRDDTQQYIKTFVSVQEKVHSNNTN